MSYKSHLAAAALAVAAAAPVLAQPAAPAVPAERILVASNSAAVFPFERPPESASAPAALGEWIASRLRAGLDASGRYSAVLYYPNSPLVMRAVGPGAGQISQADAARVIDPQRGVVDQDIALRIANAMGVTSAVLGSVEAYNFNSQANRVDITATVQWLQVPGGTPIRTVGVTATTNVPAGTTPEAAAGMAAAELAQRALAEMGLPPAPPPAMGSTTAGSGSGSKKPERRPGTGGRRSGWLGVGALLGILAVSVK